MQPCHLNPAEKPVLLLAELSLVPEFHLTNMDFDTSWFDGSMRNHLSIEQNIAKHNKTGLQFGAQALHFFRPEPYLGLQTACGSRSREVCATKHGLVSQPETMISPEEPSLVPT